MEGWMEGGVFFCTYGRLAFLLRCSYCSLFFVISPCAVCVTAFSGPTACVPGWLISWTGFLREYEEFPSENYRSSINLSISLSLTLFTYTRTHTHTCTYVSCNAMYVLLIVQMSSYLSFLLF